MFTKDDLIRDIINMGLKPDDTVFVHSSYKSIAGETGIDGGEGEWYYCTANVAVGCLVRCCFCRQCNDQG